MAGSREKAMEYYDRLRVPENRLRVLCWFFEKQNAGSYDPELDQLFEKYVAIAITLQGKDFADAMQNAFMALPPAYSIQLGILSKWKTPLSLQQIIQWSIKVSGDTEMDMQVHRLRHYCSEISLQLHLESSPHI
jgi:hypothetical protein